MNDQFIPYKQAKMMKELGFKGNCFGYYNESKGSGFNVPTDWNSGNTYLARPLYQQAEQWLWKKHKIEISHETGNHGYGYEVTGNNYMLFYSPVGDTYTSPITAHKEGILKAIEHIYNKIKK